MNLICKICTPKFFLRQSSSLNSPQNTIEIPKKIYRNDFSILKTLSSCVQNEKGTAEFTAIAQPYTFPRDYMMRKKFFLSKASGRLSARIAFREMKHDFIRVAQEEPRITQLLPLMDVSDIENSFKDGKISEEHALAQLVRLLCPETAFSFYRDTKNLTKYSLSLLLSLLELLCASGGSSLSLDSPAEDLYFSEKPSEKWRLDNPAELLFVEIPSKTRAVYCAMIRGAASHDNPERALELYEEMRENGELEGSTDLPTANSLLRSLHHSEMNDDDVRNTIVNILKDLTVHKIAPSAHTFNNAMFAFSQRKPLEFVESLYNEMISLDIEPTLGTYSILLQSSFERSFLLSLATDVVKLLEDRRDNIDYEETTSVDDRTLFTTIMSLCRRTNDANLATRLNDVVDSGGRFQLFLNEGNRGRYFDNFIKTLLKSRRCEEALSVASKYVPKCYMMQPTTVNELINMINLESNVDLQTRQLVKLMNLVNWSSMKIIETDSFPRILQLLNNRPQRSSSSSAELVTCLRKIFDNTKTRDTSALTVGDNLHLVMKIVSAIVGNYDADDLLWNLIEYGRERRCLRPSTLSPIIVNLFSVSRDFDKVSHTWKCLSECLEERADILLRSEEEKTCLSSLINTTDTVIVPTMVKFTFNVKDITRDINKCRSLLSDSSSSSDSDSEH